MRTSGVGQGAIPAAPPAPLALPQPDWLYNALTVTGPEADLGRFAQAAAGSGVVPWHLDYDRMEETWFLLMLAPPPHRRTISVQGARILARQLREKVWELHEAALSAVGRVKTCPLDLHSLVPVPFDVLRGGPDDPASLAWLWQNWGTTWALRRVERLHAGGDRLAYGFWSADWTPWAALRHIVGDWPTLRFTLRPNYDSLPVVSDAGYALSDARQSARRKRRRGGENNADPCRAAPALSARLA